MTQRPIVESTMIGAVIVVAMQCALVACRDTAQGVRTQFFGSYAFTATERRTIARVAGDTAIEVRRHLPALASQITLHVQSGKDVIPEIGATAAAISPDWVRWVVDPDNPLGVTKIAESQLRPALFHEFHHLVRGAVHPPATLMDHVISEGLATAFERDFAGVSRPWSQYPDDVDKWVQQLLSQPPTARAIDWMTRPVDGHRWVGMRAGTYLADLAMKRLNQTSAQLATTPTDEILKAAHFTTSRAQPSEQGRPIATVERMGGSHEASDHPVSRRRH